jgi:hypothetical protein
MMHREALNFEKSANQSGVVAGCTDCMIVNYPELACNVTHVFPATSLADVYHPACITNGLVRHVYDFEMKTYHYVKDIAHDVIEQLKIVVCDAINQFKLAYDNLVGLFAAFIRYVCNNPLSILANAFSLVFFLATAYYAVASFDGSPFMTTLIVVFSLSEQCHYTPHLVLILLRYILYIVGAYASTMMLYGSVCRYLLRARYLRTLQLSTQSLQHIVADARHLTPGIRDASVHSSAQVNRDILTLRDERTVPQISSRKFAGDLGIALYYHLMFWQLNIVSPILFMTVSFCVSFFLPGDAHSYLIDSYLFESATTTSWFSNFTNAVTLHRRFRPAGVLPGTILSTSHPVVPAPHIDPSLFPPVLNLPEVRAPPVIPAPPPTPDSPLVSSSQEAESSALVAPSVSPSSVSTAAEKKPVAASDLELETRKWVTLGKGRFAKRARTAQRSNADYDKHRRISEEQDRWERDNIEFGHFEPYTGGGFQYVKTSADKALEPAPAPKPARTYVPKSKDWDSLLDEGPMDFSKPIDWESAESMRDYISWSRKAIEHLALKLESLETQLLRKDESASRPVVSPLSTPPVPAIPASPPPSGIAGSASTPLKLDESLGVAASLPAADLEAEFAKKKREKKTVTFKEAYLGVRPSYKRHPTYSFGIIRGSTFEHQLYGFFVNGSFITNEHVFVTCPEMNNPSILKQIRANDLYSNPINVSQEALDQRVVNRSLCKFRIPAVFKGIPIKTFVPATDAIHTVSVECALLGPDVGVAKGVTATGTVSLDDNRLSHCCDTIGGYCGLPLIVRADSGQAIVGIHDATSGETNYAIPIDEDYVRFFRAEVALPTTQNKGGNVASDSGTPAKTESAPTNSRLRSGLTFSRPSPSSAASSSNSRSFSQNQTGQYSQNSAQVSQSGAYYSRRNSGRRYYNDLESYSRSSGYSFPPQRNARFCASRGGY